MTNTRTRSDRYGHVRPKQPLIDLHQPGWLRTGNVLALCNFSHSTLYDRMKRGLFPVPDGVDGGRNYWKTSTILKLLEGDGPATTGAKGER